MKDLETHEATPYMKNFFNNIFAIQVMLEKESEKKPEDAFLSEVLSKLKSTITMNEEMK